MKTSRYHLIEVVYLLALTMIIGLVGWTMRERSLSKPTIEYIELDPIVVRDSSLYWAGKYDIDAELAKQIMDLAEEYGFDKELVFSVIRTESSFRPDAKSAVGAIGLMQVMPRTARIYHPGITKAELYDEETNIRIGLSYLRDMIDEFGTIEGALIAYNAGPGRARRILDKHGTDVYYVRTVLAD